MFGGSIIILRIIIIKRMIAIFNDQDISLKLKINLFVLKIISLIKILN